MAHSKYLYENMVLEVTRRSTVQNQSKGWEKKKAIDVLSFYTGDDREDEIRTFLVFMSPVTNSCHRETLNSVSGKFSFKHLVFQSFTQSLLYCDRCRLWRKQDPSKVTLTRTSATLTKIVLAWSLRNNR